ncbi:hypothetical protein N7532_000414 [Penicillium argentinense]|uniref:Aminoglycoside phosphotransferase domain-containing protein n=1 Tax=Penicillium argentinense TaxID=1131581 RepID=A0A9W9G5G8_9EURO|nr:uncharacterized protein N7532_000414 [Penicillium argentinense]KAJ5112369.1 hypothetical protein N7532_000414 [Penicillium argentinense]
MATNTIEKDEERDQIAQQLSRTSFHCSTLTRLSGGTANFVYRGTLSGTSDSIIVKHTKDHVASKPSLKIDNKRCHFEEAVLRALEDLPPYNQKGITVKTPRLLYFDPQTNTQIFEDLPNSVDLKTFMLSAISKGVSKSTATALGRTLGAWLRSLHEWGNRVEQDETRTTLSQNESMKQIKFWANYAMLVDTISNFPEILETNRGVLEEVRDFAKDELSREDDSAEYGIIHGDFWTGNVLIPNVPLKDESATTVFVIDWEMTQIGSRAMDLGQMIAELYETELFGRSEAGVWIMDGFLEGYGSMSDEMAFRTAVHVGVHLVCWGSRVPGWGSKEQVEDVVKVGSDFIVHGWKKDREWFEGQTLSFLFKK